jgi:glycosyltransferase involved in cell wall biosynthesis
MPLPRIIIDVSNLSTDPYRWLRTGIQEYNYQTLRSYVRLRSALPEFEIILFPRFRIWGIETNSAHILSAVEESLAMPSEEIWGIDLKKHGYYLGEGKIKALIQSADKLHIQSVLDISALRVDSPATRLSAIIHDLIPYLFPEFFDNHFGDWYRTRYLDPLRHTSKLICVSRNTAIDLLGYYGKSAAPGIEYLRIPATLEPSSEVSNILSRFNLEKKNFLLTVGSLEPRKNIVPLIEGWEVYRHHFSESNLKLVLVGGTGWLNTDIFRRIFASNLKDDIVLTGYVSDDELAALMQSSAGLAMISVYEGLGLPLCQANDLGTPVLTHIGSSLPEACNMDGVFVRPDDTWSIAAGIRRLVEIQKQPRPGEHTFGWLDYCRQILNELCKSEK